MSGLSSASRWALAALLGAAAVTGEAAAQPLLTVDLLTSGTPPGEITRIYGYTGDGRMGVPIAGGWDCDGDSFVDLALASVKADPLGRTGAGEVVVLFGDGTIGGTIDLADQPSPGFLKIAGVDEKEVTGASLWMDDVTGDGIGDVLIGRQNHTPAMGRDGAGALSVVVGGGALRDIAASLATEEPMGYLDLADPPEGATILTIVGAAAYDRLGIWVRTGDVDGDGIADMAVGADQVDGDGVENQGAVYVIRGGPHLATTDIVDLADFGTMAFQSSPAHEQVARIDPPGPPEDSTDYHLGATCQVADLDDNGRAEVLAAAALNRASAAIGLPGGETDPIGGAPHGKLFIAWDDNFPAAPAAWNDGLTVDLGAPPGSATSVQGSTTVQPVNDKFGEEILGGLDYDGDGLADLFVGDLTADTVNGSNSGLGHVFYDAAQLKPPASGLLAFALDDESWPVEIGTSLVLGPRPGAIGIDTAAHGDYDGDGIADLTACHPHDEPEGRSHAGSVHVLYGEVGGWPDVVDLSPAGMPGGEVTRIVEIQGALGDDFAVGDTGDNLCYSAAWGDVDGEGRMDLLINEMAGNGLAPGTNDVGNYLVISGPALLPRVLLDVDGNGTASALSDGILILRHLFGFTLSGMEGAIEMGATRTPEEIQHYLKLTGAAFDADGDDSVGPLTDGILILRYLFGFEDDVLVDKATAPGASRTDPAQITAFLDRLMPAP